MSPASYPGTGARPPWPFASRQRLFFTLFLVVAIPTLFLMALTSAFVKNRLTRQAAFENLSVARLSARQVDEEFYGLRRYVASFAGRYRMIEAISRKDQAVMQGEIVEMVEQNKKIAQAILTDANGVLIVDFPVGSSKGGKEFPDRDWFKGASGQEHPYVSEIYQGRDVEREELVAIATKVRDNNGKLLGYLTLKYAINELASSLDSIKPTGLGEVCLFDQNGRLALPVKLEKPREIAESKAIKSVLGQKENWLTAPLDNLGPCLIAHVPIPDLGWTIVSYQPASIILAAVHQLQRSIFLFFLISLLAIGILGWLWMRVLYSYSEELRRSNQELEKFCYSIAHDLRAPLRSMNGLTVALCEEYGEKLEATGKDYAKRIVASATRMDRLIQDLLEYGRIAHSALDRQQLDLNLAFQPALFALQDRIARVNATIEVGPDLGQVAGDPKIVSEVFLQLLSNALKYSRRDTLPQVKVWSEAHENSVRVFIKDNGIGIERVYFEKIFGVFQRLHGYGSYSGTGIGLAIVRKGLERMGGIVCLDSEPGKGSTFCIELPKR